MPHLSAQPFCLLPRFRPSTIQFNQAKLFSRASPVACTWLLLLLMLLLLLVAVVVVHVVAAYCHKTLRRAPLKDICQTDMLPTHGLKGETVRYRISLSTTPLVCSFCPTPFLFSSLLSLFTPLPFVPVSYLHVSCHALLLWTKNSSSLCIKLKWQQQLSCLMSDVKSHLIEWCEN